jgi:hypothetical protein
VLETYENGKNFWLLKTSNLNRGRCIHVFSTQEQLQNLLLMYAGESTHLIQKCIEKPFLLNNKKLAIKVWVLVSSYGK